MDVQIFVQNVKRLCNAKGISPSTACKEIGVGTSFIPDIKRGRIPSVDKFEKLADYLGTTVSDLLGEKKEPATVSGDGQAEKLAKALEGIGIDVDNLSDAEISRIARLAKAALEE